MNDNHSSPDPAVLEAARHWIARLSSGDIEENELAAYRGWATDPEHHRVFQRELALWRSLGSLADRLARPVELPTRRRRKSPIVVAVAASVAVMLAAPEAVLMMRADHRTHTTIREVTLPDGSRATLDAGSAIAVNYNATERRIDLLRGRAWFDVAHGNPAPFRVTANGGVVEDIGTAFVVMSEGDDAETAVTAGKVRVLFPEATQTGLALAGGQRARWKADKAPTRIDDLPSSRIAAWREGDILLDSVSVRAAVREIGRYRSGPTFVMGKVDDLSPVTAIIRADRADEGLDALAASAHLEITRLPTGIAIVRPAS